MRVRTLIEKLKKYPSENVLLAQVVATDGSAWNLDIDCYNLSGKQCSVIRLSHPELHTMPEWSGDEVESAGVDYPYCPFCGSYERVTEKEMKQPPIYRQVCLGCGATGPVANTLSEAYDKWKERATEGVKK